jgi:Niemann-Pick C1 protein
MILDDMRMIVRDYGLPGTWTYSRQYLNYESYYQFIPETITSSASSFAAIVVILLFITFDFTATFLVALCVALVDLFLLALLFFWGLTFNTIVVLQIVIALGLAVDYSAHIAHCYLVVVPPPGSCTTPDEERMYKVKKSLS